MASWWRLERIPVSNVGWTAMRLLPHFKNIGGASLSTPARRLLPFGKSREFSAVALLLLQHQSAAFLGSKASQSECNLWLSWSVFAMWHAR